VTIITSRQNSIVARFREVTRSHRNNRERILLEGLTLINDARKANVPLEVAVFSTDESKKRSRELHTLANRLKLLGVDVIRASNSVLEALSPAHEPSGVVAIGIHQPIALRNVFADGGLVLAPIGVQDPGNVGAIIRSADAGSASGIVVTGGSADPFGWRALRGAMGSTFRLPVVDIDNLDRVVNMARKRNASVLAAVPKGGSSIYTIDLTGDLLVLLGNESSGLNSQVASYANNLITVPMRNSVNSLNTAVAASLIIYEANRQRKDNS